MRTLVGAALSIAVACSAPASAPKPPPQVPRSPADRVVGPVSPVEPLAIPAVAARPDLALILGARPDGVPVAIRLAGEPRRVTIEVPYARAGDPPTGGTTEIVATVGPAPDGRTRVAVHEHSSSGLGDAWRSAVWRAALVTAGALGKPPGAFRFEVETTGFIDGPAAGGALASAFLAAATGAEIAEDVAIVGAVGPDGSIGPVVLTKARVIGAIAAGKRRIGIPGGQRSTTTGEDLAALASDRGAALVELADIYDAYELATGTRLPAPSALAPEAMALPAPVRTALTERYADWRRQLGLHWDAILAMRTAGKLPNALADMARHAETLGARAEALHRAGEAEAAYAYVTRATVYASAASTLWQVVATVRDGDVRGAAILADVAFAADDPSVALLGTIGASAQTTIGHYLAQISAFELALEARGFHAWGASHVTTARRYLDTLARASKAALGARETATQLVSAMAVPVLAFSLAEARARQAADALAMETALAAPAFAASAAAVQRLAVPTASTASADLKYFEAVVVSGLAAELTLTEEDVRGRLGVIEPDYVVAQMALRAGLVDADPGARRLRDTWGDTSIAWAAYSVAAGHVAHRAAASIVASWYSLGATRDYGAGLIESVANEAALVALSASADRAARRHAHAALVAVGFVPVSARRHYLRARALATGDLGARIRGVGALWASSLASQTALRLVSPTQPVPAPVPAEIDSSTRRPAPADTPDPPEN